MWLAFRALTRAFQQCDDRAFLNVLVLSLVWSSCCFVGLLLFVVWGSAHAWPWMASTPSWLRWLTGLFGTIGAALLAFWLFVPVAAAIGTLFVNKIAAAVERRFYPGLPPPVSASFQAQLWDALSLGVRVLLLSICALVLALLIPGIGTILGWAISGWAIGRGLFVSVAMRRMGLREAEALHRIRRLSVLAIGGVLAMAAFIPFANLLIPVIGVAAMVHILHGSRQSPQRSL